MSTDHLFKVLLAGDSGVGKSSVLLRFADDTFTTNKYATIGIDFKIRTFEQDGKSIKLQVWDSPSQGGRGIPAMYYNGAHAVMVIYDVSEASTFRNVKSWLQEADKLAPSSVTKVLIGNKSDTTMREVAEAEARQFAEGLGVMFFEVSAKEGSGVNDAFLKMTTEMRARVAAVAK